MIKLWAAAHGIDQRQLAEELGTTGATVSRFVNGQNMPDGATTARIIGWLFEPCDK